MTSGTSGDDDAAWRPPAAPAPAAAPPELLVGYTDLVEVGRGGDSVVYRAHETSMDREVAIKVLLLDDPVRVARFQRELQITVGLGRQHPNIVTVLATGTTASGRPAIVMDYHEGGTLHDRLRAHGPLPPEEVGRIGAVLADALSFAHDRGVLHRDVKPQNVLVLPTSWVLADFGIARLADSEHTSSAETFTYRHAAPQVLDGMAPTAADDLWSLGSTLYTLLDGRPPFASDDPDDDSALAYLRRVRVEPHRPLAVGGAEQIAPIIERCLQKDVAARWASAAELRDAFLGLRVSAWGPSSTADPTAPRPPDQGQTDQGPVDPRPVDRHPAPTPTPVLPTPPLPAPQLQPPAEPAPVALSVASHTPEVADEQPTGTGLPDATGPDPRAAGVAASGPPGAPGVEAGDARPSRRRPLLLVAAALVVALVAGTVAHALRHHSDPAPVPTAVVGPPSAGVPSLAAPPTGAKPYRGRFDPKLTFVLSSFKYDGANLHLEWTDPTDGDGTFILERVLPDEEPVATFPAGYRTWDLTTTLPPGKSCYYMVVALATGEFGRSGRRCWPER